MKSVDIKNHFFILCKTHFPKKGFTPLGLILKVRIFWTIFVILPL